MSSSAVESLNGARNATLIVFAAAGLVGASFAARIPDIKHLLGLTPGQLGWVLLGTSAGSVLGLPVSGRVTHRWGAHTGVRIGLVSSTIGLSIASVAINVAHSPVMLWFALFCTGIGIGIWDVSMNLEGAAVERGLRRSIMPWFHAAFSGGTVLAALVGALMAALQVPVGIHLLAAVAIVDIVTLVSVRRFIPAIEQAHRDAATSGNQRSAWTEPRTLLIGLVVLSAAFAEGSANDWLGVAFSDGHRLPHWAGVLGLADFLGFMTLGRIAGTRALDRYGRTVVIRLTFTLAAIGCLLVVFGGLAFAYAGAACWGMGASLGFPVGMSAASDEAVRAPARLSVVSTIGYLAFLGGPPLLGFLGDHLGVLHALLVVGATVIVAFLVVPAVRPLPGSPADR